MSFWIRKEIRFFLSSPRPRDEMMMVGGGIFWYCCFLGVGVWFLQICRWKIKPILIFKFATYEMSGNCVKDGIMVKVLFIVLLLEYKSLAVYWERERVRESWLRSGKLSSCLCPWWCWFSLMLCWSRSSMDSNDLTPFLRSTMKPISWCEIRIRS